MTLSIELSDTVEPVEPPHVQDQELLDEYHYVASPTYHDNIDPLKKRIFEIIEDGL